MDSTIKNTSEELFEPVQNEEATEILRKRRRAYCKKPLKFCSKAMYRNFVKKFYSTKKSEERTIGLRIDQLVNAFHYEMALFKKSPDKEIGEEKKKYIDALLAEAVQLRGAPRITKEFPSFNSFWKYVKEEKITREELQESLDED